MQRREIGRIIRLQVQVSSMKAGPPKARFYDPTPINEVAWLDLNHDGVTAVIDGERIVDVHNATHPASKNRARTNGLSVGFTSHYERMRERFAGHIIDGIAGENILVETDEPISLDEISDGLIIEGAGGRAIELSQVSVAHPCVEFSRFALNDLSAPPSAVSEALRFLEHGLRGYYALVTLDLPLRVQPGDRVDAIHRD